MVRIHVLILALLSFLLAGLPARGGSAQDTDSEAKALFAAGREAFDAGRYDAALEHWQRSYDLSKRPELYYNIGLAHDRLRHDDEAVKAFTAFLDALPNDERAAGVRARINAIRAAHVPTATETAAAAPPIPVPSTSKTTADQVPAAESTPWYGRWYIWAGVGGVVVGAVVVGLVVSSSSSDQVTRAKPTSGVTVQALGATW